jgi:predicted peroxiredoxin
MKVQNGLTICAAIMGLISLSSSAYAKTAKECTAEWRADKAGMQARGVTEKAYVEQCKGGAEPSVAAPAQKPADAAPLAPKQATSPGAKTAKDCTAEWRADRAGMQARGITEKAYVEQCKVGASPTAVAPPPKPTAVTPSPSAAPTQSSGSPMQKTAKDCIAEWRADKAGMQARGVTEKAYVERCKVGGGAPTATAPESKPPAVAPTQASPATPPPPAQPAQKPAPTTTAAPVPAPAQQPPATKGGTTLEAGQFADEASAKGRCPSDTVVWVNLPSKIYHFAGTKSYGTTKRGAYMCEKEAITGENRASKTEKHP